MTILKANAYNCLTCAYMEIIHDEGLLTSEMENKYPDMNLYKTGVAYQCMNDMIPLDDDELRLIIAYAFSGKRFSCKFYAPKLNE